MSLLEESGSSDGESFVIGEQILFIGYVYEQVYDIARGDDVVNL